ncbi:MAG: MnhB domain-containing protein [Verrucomicrobiota bacterium JB025]|nr:MnhB domain-containing protein [Verrucomicrobiota bacterium JB025]
MNSLLLRIAARYLSWPLLVVSLWLLYRGHNLPGGGFIGGLLAASAFMLYELSGYGRPQRGFFSISPFFFMPVGLGVAVLSALPGLLGGAFMKGLWLPGFELPLLGKVHLGTPLLFDIGVYLTVIGFILLLADTLNDESS